MSSMCSKFFEREFLRLCLLLTILGICGSDAKIRRRLTLKTCGTRNTRFARIVGGNFVRPADYPWMVTVHENYDGFDHVCGGAILNEHWIVTAAHCIYHPNKPDKYVIYTGLDTLSKKDQRKTTRHKISKVIVHEDFDNDTFHNDIALLRTRQPIDFKGSRGLVNGVCLPTTDDDPIGWATITGWGHTVENGELSDIMRAVKVPIIPRDECSEVYDDVEDDYDEIFDSMICAGEADKDSCQYDSGGPLVQKGEKGVYTLIGIVSFGEGCGNGGFPGVYTKVASYIDWLLKNVY